MNDVSNLEMKIKAVVQQILPQNHQNICFEIKGDTVTLNGTVNQDFEREALDNAICILPGVINLKDNIKVGTEIASEKVKNNILQLLHGKMEIPIERIRLCITPKTIEVRGTVKWNYQKKATLDIIKSVKEDREIADFLVVDPTISTVPVKDEILGVLRTDVRLSADDINVIANGHHIILVGSVLDEYQKSIAQKIVHDIPGVRSVRNELHIR